MVKLYQCQLFCLLIVFKFWRMPVYLIIKLKTELMSVNMCVCESVASQDSVYRNITASVHIDHSLRFMLLLLSFTRSHQGLFYVHRLSHVVSCTPRESHKAHLPEIHDIAAEKINKIIIIESWKTVTSCCCSASRRNK